MAEEKTTVTFPEVVPGSSKGKRHTLLISWASISTALLLVLIIVGSVYVSGLRSDVQVLQDRSHNQFKTYEERMERGEEEITERGSLDAGRHTEFLYQKTSGGNIHTVMSVDYRQSLAYLFVPSNEECYLLSDLPVTWEQSWNAAMNGTVHERDIKEVIHYKRSDRPVTDYSLMPSDISEFCYGKPTYWLARTSSNDDRRVARGGRVRILWGLIDIQWD